MLSPQQRLPPPHKALPILLVHCFAPSFTSVSFECKVPEFRTLLDDKAFTSADPLASFLRALEAAYPDVRCFNSYHPVSMFLEKNKKTLTPEELKKSLETLTNEVLRQQAFKAPVIAWKSTATLDKATHDPKKSASVSVGGKWSARNVAYHTYFDPSHTRLLIFVHWLGKKHFGLTFVHTQTWAVMHLDPFPILKDLKLDVKRMLIRAQNRVASFLPALRTLWTISSGSGLQPPNFTFSPPPINLALQGTDINCALFVGLYAYTLAKTNDLPLDTPGKPDAPGKSAFTSTEIQKVAHFMAHAILNGSLAF